MGNMEFISQNIVNTTSLFSATITAILSDTAYLIDRKSMPVYQYSVTISSDLTVDLKVASSNTMTMNLICLNNVSATNFHRVSIYTENTAGTLNALTLTNGETTTSIWSTFTGNKYLLFSTLTCVNVYFRATFTTTSGSTGSLYIGDLFIGNRYFRFTDNPSYNDYTPVKINKQFIHETADGGVVKYKIQDNYRSSIKKNFVSQAEYDNIKTLYDLNTPFVFIPNPTTTSWDGKIYEVNWTNDFNFDAYAHNYKGNGYVGSIDMSETPK